MLRTFFGGDLLLARVLASGSLEIIKPMRSEQYRSYSSAEKSRIATPRGRNESGYALGRRLGL